MGEVVTQERRAMTPQRFEATDLSERPAPRMTFLPANMTEAMQLADLMADSNFVPKHLRGKPGDCLAVIMQSSLWGMNCYAVANKTYFVNDRMAYEAQLVNAVINSSGALEGRLHPVWEGQGENLICTVTGKLRGDTQTKERRVQLKGLSTRNSPLWKQDPEQQLAYYATRAWARLYAPEVLMGVYTPDEVLEMGPADAVDGGTVKSSKVSLADLSKQAGREESAADHSLATDAEFLSGDGTGTALPEASNEERESEGLAVSAEPEQGRTDEQHGDQHDGGDFAGTVEDELSPAERRTLTLIDACARASKAEHITYVTDQVAKHEAALELDQIGRIEAAVKDAKKRLKL